MGVECKVLDGSSEVAYQRWQAPDVSSGAGHAGGLTAGELEQIVKQAQAEGFAQGEADGRRAGQERIEALADSLSATLDCLSEPLRAMDEEVEKSLVALSIAIAKQMVRRELKIDPGIVVSAVREAAQVLPVASRGIRVFLHPEDMHLVRDAMGGEFADGRWSMTEDPAMQRGGCRMETDSSKIDAAVETRLAAVIADVLGGERDGD